MYTSAIKTGMKYLVASIIIAAAAAVYGLFSHGVYSYFMTYAFMIPLLGGAMPHLIAAMKKGTGSENGNEFEGDVSIESGLASTVLSYATDMQLAFIATLTAGSLMKGVLDIYGTTNRLLIVYPVTALLLLAVYAAAIVRSKTTKVEEAVS